MKICFASLRKKINYTDVLEHEFTYYNFACGSKGAERDINALKHADIVVFPAVQEFIYFADAMHPRDVEKSQAEIRKTYEYLNGKDIILLTQDRGVNEEMVMQYTFEKQVKPKSFQTIDEMDFTMCLQGLKYHYIKNYFRFPVEKKTDFVYWGSDKSKTAGGVKSNDERLEIIKSISKNEEVSSTIIGRWPKSIRIERKWVPLKETLGYLDQSYSTLCFNWIDQTAVTGRYHEAMACDVFPFVWKDYDTNDILITDEWQRCFTKDELYDKIKDIKKSDYRMIVAKTDFLKRLPSEKDYYKEFETVFNKCLKS